MDGIRDLGGFVVIRSPSSRAGIVPRIGSSPTTSRVSSISLFAEDALTRCCVFVITGSFVKEINHKQDCNQSAVHCSQGQDVMSVTVQC